MAKFKDLSQSYKGEDRAVGDRQRHMDFVREQMKSNLPELLEELDIFRSDDKISGNIQKITLKMAREYRFVFDQNRDDGSGVGQSVSVKPGDVLGKAGSKEGDVAGGKGSREADLLGVLGGDIPGKLILELTPEEIDDVLDEAARDLNLPFLSPKKFNSADALRESRWKGLKETGIEPRLDLEASYVEKIKREQMLSRRLKDNGKTGRLKFIRDDLRYHGLGIREVPQSKVLVIFIMDVSGSMDKIKRYYAKAFCYALYNFIRTKYRSAEKVFIAHDTDATEVDSDTFFKLSSNGGTFISSGPRKALNIVRQRFDPEIWDIYCVHCSDGENNNDDEDKVIPAFKELLPVSKLVGFLEIKPENSRPSFVLSISKLSSTLTQNIKDKRFKVMIITAKDEVRPVFDAFLNIEQGG